MCLLLLDTVPTDNGLSFALYHISARHPDIGLIEYLALPYAGGESMDPIRVENDENGNVLYKIPEAFANYSTVTIRGADSEVVHKIPEKYLPEMNNEELEEDISALNDNFTALNDNFTALETRVMALETSIGELNAALENALEEAG